MLPWCILKTRGTVDIHIRALRWLLHAELDERLRRHVHDWPIFLNGIYISVWNEIGHTLGNEPLKPRSQRYYILENKKLIPVSDVVEWGKWLDNNDRVVDKTNVPFMEWPVVVSTVFTGHDGAFFGTFPLLFETMIFSQKWLKIMGDPLRYSTYEEAEVGHKVIVKAVEAIAKDKQKWSTETYTHA